MTAEGVEAFLEGRVLVLTGDITIQRVDAIVNAANPTLLGGGGVDGAIHKAGGPEILAACQELRRTQYPQGLRTGKAVITTAGRLASRYVIHTVGPVKGRHGQRDAEFLALCYRNALELAVQYKLNSLAFPAISTGMYGYPREEAAVIASTTIASVLKDVPSLREVRLVFFSGPILPSSSSTRFLTPEDDTFLLKGGFARSRSTLKSARLGWHFLRLRYKVAAV